MMSTSRPRLTTAIRTATAAAAAAALIVLAGCSGSTEANDGDVTADEGADAPAADFADSSEWAAAEYGEFETFTASGSGEETVELPAEIESGIVTVEQTEMIPASPDFLDESGETLYAVDVEHQAGDTRHVAIFMTEEDDSPVASIEMPDDESWSLAIEPISALPELPDSNDTAGAFLFDGPAGDYTFDGDMDVLSVRQMTPAETLVVSDEPGAPGPLVEGPSIVVVIADDAWTAETA